MRLDLACFVAGLTGTGLFIAGCSVSTSTTTLAGGTVPVKLGMSPAIARAGESVLVSVTSPNADSIQLRSANGLDRYSEAGPALRVSLDGDFGEDEPRSRFAVRSHGRLLNVIRKPFDVYVCHDQVCRAYSHDLLVRLPEQNRRKLAVTGGWSTAFTTRAIRGSDQPVSRRGGTRSEWNLQAELASGPVNARLQGFAGPEWRGASLDVSRELKHGEGMSYGLAVHLEGIQAEWDPAAKISALGKGMVYSASVGPAIMLRGITASSQLGIYTDGRGVMQQLSTFISINGALTEVRLPVTVTLDKTIAFGDQAPMSRRQEQLQRLTIAWEFLPSLAFRLGVAASRSSWPSGAQTSDLHASEAAYSLGAQYTFGW